MSNNKTSTFANRLKQALDTRNVKAVDLVNRTGIAKSSISGYLSGKCRAKQKALMELAKALNVSEMWLDGYPCSMERGNDSERILSNEEQAILVAYRMQSPEFKKAVRLLLGIKEEIL